MNNPEYIVLHHSAAKGDFDIAHVKSWHLERGFSDVGYHYFIKNDGTIQKGREEHVVGAHCRDGGMNRKSIGICLNGNCDEEPWNFEQIASLLKLVKDIRTRYAIPTEKVIGHWEAGANKTCPGKLIDMDTFRKITSFAS